MKAARFWDTLKQHRVSLFSGVPCSLLKEILEAAETDPAVTYVPAVREDAALGLASGAYLSGQRGGILIQNSGLGNIVNGLTSFNLLYEIPVLLGISWRGHGPDAPEHIMMGKKMPELLNWLEIPTFVLPATDGAAVIGQAVETMDRTRRPAALIIPPGVMTR